MRAGEPPSYLDLFSRPAGRDLVRYERPAPDRSEAAPPPAAPGAKEDVEALALPHGTGRPDPRFLTPREMQDVSLDLYANGHLTFEDYAELAFQPELHPAYPKTIGSLTGEPADPDRPRDFIKVWQDRLAYEQRHNPADAPTVKQAERIVEVLTAMTQPPLDVEA